MIPWLITTLADIYVLLIFVYVIMSWLPNNNSTINAISDGLGTICEPYLALFRKIIPPAGGLDFSPIVAILVLQLVVRLLF